MLFPTQAYNASKTEGEETRAGYYMATCSDSVLTVTSYGDTECVTEKSTSSFAATNEDTCSANSDDDDLDLGYNRQYVYNCDGSNDEAILAAWNNYDFTYKEEFDELVNFLDKNGGLYDQKVFVLFLTLSSTGCAF